MPRIALSEFEFNDGRLAADDLAGRRAAPRAQAMLTRVTFRNQAPEVGLDAGIFCSTAARDAAARAEGSDSEISYVTGRAASLTA